MNYGIDIRLHMPNLASGLLDSNQRPPGPKPGALPSCAKPRKKKLGSDLIFTDILI